MISKGSPSPVRFSKWHAASSAVRANTGDARILCAGDSTTWGVGTGPNNNYPKRLTELLNSHLIQASYGTTFGRDVSWPDSRVTHGAGWTSTGFLMLGSQGFQGTVGGGSLSFTPDESFDTITVYYVKGPLVSGISTINVDGGASLGNIDGTSATNVMASTSFTCALGTHTVNVTSPTGASIWLVAIETSDSTTSKVLVGNAGHSLTTTTDWAQNPTNILSAKASIDIYQPHLSIINLSINDSSVSVSSATVRSNLSSLVGYCQAYGDVILVNPTPCGVEPNITNQRTYTPVISSLADSLGCGYVDLTARWVDWTTADGLGLFYDDYHPTITGYADVGAAIYSYLHLIT